MDLRGRLTSVSIVEHYEPYGYTCKICEKACEWGAIQGPKIIASECVRCDDCERIYADEQSFKLIRTPSVTITDIRAQYTTGSGVVNADVTAGALYRDNNDDGVVDGGDALLSSGIAGAGGELAFTVLTEDPGLGKNYLVVVTVNNLALGDTTTFSLGTADIDEVQVGVVEAGSITSAVHTTNVARTVYYSVGTSAADFKNGAPTVTISLGTATFTTPQPANVSVGDEVTYNGGTMAYISGRTSAYVYSVMTVTGLVPPTSRVRPWTALRALSTR